jgi:hypothetical protein
MGKSSCVPFDTPVLRTLVLSTLYPVEREHSVAIIFAHFVAALAGVSYNACTICTATSRMDDSPVSSIPSIDVSLIPLCCGGPG